MKSIKVLLAGGGTGGHIYPALAVAQYIQNQYPKHKIEFVGSQRGLEKDIIPKHNYKLHRLSVGQLHSSVGRLKQLATLLRMPWVMLQSLWILICFRPTFVFGVGGYASGPVVLMASLLGFRTAIWEANVQPGITNKFLSRFVRHCFVVFEDSLKFFPINKTKCVGYPVREEFEQTYHERKKILNHRFQVIDLVKASEAPLKVLIFGGSQGAAVFNRVLPKVMPQFPEMSFVLQTGNKNFESFKGQNWGEHIKVLPFLDPIIEHYQSADLVICRSGAGAIAELAAMGLNCLFVPLPTAADDHQRKNAESLFHRGASDMIQEDSFTPEQLAVFLQEFQQRPQSQRLEMQKKMLEVFKPGATQAIVSQILG